MKIINPYLNFNGNTEEAFKFYQSVFGGEIPVIMRFKDTEEAGKVKPEDLEKIMHIALEIGNGNVIMGTDALDYLGHSIIFGTNINFSLSAVTKEEADQLFNSLSAGGNASSPMRTQFWGDYFGMLTDKFGIQWMISYNPNQH